MSLKDKCLWFIVFLLAAAGSIFIYFLFKGNTFSECKDCNIIMISLSNTAANHMSLYGYERDTTPNLNIWAQDALVFENAFTQSSWTLPASVSVFTSLYPYSHKIMNRDIGNVLDPDIITLPELLRDNGYKTAAFTGGLDYYPFFSYMRGIEEYEINPPFTEFDVTLSQAQEWLEKNKKDKFFLMVHGYDTHCPFTPPDEFRGIFSNPRNTSADLNEELCFRGYREKEGDIYKVYSFRNKIASNILFTDYEQLDNRKRIPFLATKFSLTQEDIYYLEALYDEEILAMDQKVFNFLEALPQEILDKTVIIIFSDHGEMFARHGRFGRAGAIRGTLYDDVLKVPLIIKVPHQEEGKRITEIAQLIDIMPTLAEIVGVNLSSDSIQGKSLMGTMNEEDERRARFSYAGVIFDNPSIRAEIFYEEKTVNESVRNLEWKLIHEEIFDERGIVTEETYELYNIANDPDELVDIKDDQPIIFGQLRSNLRTWRNEAEQFFSKKDNETQALPDELIEAARERGY